MEKKNIFVVGLNQFNLGELNSISDAEKYNFIPLLRLKDLMPKAGKPDIVKLIKEAKDQLDNFEGSIDGIIGFFDFPVTLLSFYLSDEYNTNGPSLRSGIQCEHKYWSRLEQQKIIPENIPGFTAINPFEPIDFDDITLAKPFWIKPIKAHSSRLGFKINHKEEYEASLKEIREGIHVFGEPFNTLLSKVDLPKEVGEVDGNYCIAEEIISGHQCTVSGYVYNGEVEVYDIVDSISYQDSSSFFYYFLPSRLPESVQEKVISLSRKVMAQHDFDNSPFNIEYYYDKKSNDIKLLEINPRISKSHTDLYAKVYGHSNHEVLVKIASGEDPDYVPESGTYKCAAKLHYRAFEDGIVQKVPTEEEIKKVKEEFPDTVLFVKVKEGDKLSDLPAQDSYSYLLAIFYVGAENEEELLEKYQKIIDRLNIKIDFFNEAD